MSEIITDKLTGRATANDVTVTVGATATQSLEQGLAKVFCGYVSVTSTSVRVSHNVSSLTDNGTGNTTISFSNSFDSATSLCCADVHATSATIAPSAAYFDGATIVPYNTIATSSIRHFVGYRVGATSSFSDDYYPSVIITGDLA